MPEGQSGNGCPSVWWVFAWGVGLNFAYDVIDNTRHSYRFRKFLRKPKRTTHGDPSTTDILIGGTIISTWAGVVEELCFRWILYLSAIPALVFGNWLWGTMFSYALLFLIFLGLAMVLENTLARAILLVTGVVALVALFIHGSLVDPIRWLYEFLINPVADFTSLGKLHAFLYPAGDNPDAWAAGAAIVSANLFFRDGHKYQGFLGWTNSWFIGMVFFWVMFTFGLVPAMLVHFLYDLLIFIYAALRRAVRGS